MTSHSDSPGLGARLDAIVAVAHRGDRPLRQQDELWTCLDEALSSDAGIDVLLDRMPALVNAGLFAGSAWDNPARLMPPLVKSSILAAGPAGLLEACSELRMLAIALGSLQDERSSPGEARQFLVEAVVLNLELVQQGASEEHRLAGGAVLDRARRVIALVVDRLPARHLERVLLKEIEELCRQRRILGAAAVDMIRRAKRYADPEGNRHQRALARYVAGIEGVTERARNAGDADAYGKALGQLSAAELGEEARAHGRSLRATGLASPHHAVLVRRLAKEPGGLKQLGAALALDRMGRTELARHEALVRELIDVAVTPASPLAISGLAGVLGRAGLSMPGVAPGLRNLLVRPPCQVAERRLYASRPFTDAPSWPRSLLVAGALAVVGQPLGVGQGDNPSCQSARAISLWSQVAPGYLLELLTSAAFDDCTRIRFRGVELCSADLPEAALGTDLRLDPASVVLVPHLHRTYQAMLKIVGNSEDPHKWVNPGLYGPWVPTGFVSIFDRPRPLDHETFVREFLAVHHPDPTEIEPIHPRPLGLVVTSAHGQYLGLHAISLQRMAEGPDGSIRAYFYNPNDDGRQDWGQGIITSTSGHGEVPGESSLPVAAFASRIYAFHYHRHELERANRAPEAVVTQAAELAASSWGRSFPAPPPKKDAVEPESGGTSPTRA